jgi:hypothetical protein
MVPRYESEGLAGAVSILTGAQTIRQDAWQAVFSAHKLADSKVVATRALRTALALDHLFRAWWSTHAAAWVARIVAGKRTPVTARPSPAPRVG